VHFKLTVPSATPSPMTNQYLAFQGYTSEDYQ